jgi:hypothetical protein
MKPTSARGSTEGVRRGVPGGDNSIFGWTRRRQRNSSRAPGQCAAVGGDQAAYKTRQQPHTLVQGWPRRHMHQQTPTRAAVQTEHGNMCYGGNDVSVAAERGWHGGVG